MEGVGESVDSTLGLSLLALMALFGIEASPMHRFGLFVGVSFGWERGRKWPWGLSRE